MVNGFWAVFGLWIIHILAVKGHDIVEHTLGLDSGAVGVKLYGSYIAVDGFMPFRLFTKGIALFVPFLGGSKLYAFHSKLLLIVFFLAGSQRVLHQRTDGHRTYATRNGGDE